MKKFRAGIVGAGFIGPVHIEQLRRLGNVDVVALTDIVDASQKAEALFIPKGYADFKQMIDNENLDCIHICTANSTHYDIAMYAIERGVNIVCEKPMARTVREAEEMTAFAKKKNIINALNFNYRFYPMPYQLMQMVKSGDLGEIYTVHGSYLQDWMFFDTDYNWRLEPALSGESRAFADIGSHWIDLVEFITSMKAVEVMADFATFHPIRKKPKKAIETYSGMALEPEDYEPVAISTEDVATVLFKLENGARACCNISQVFAGRKNQLLLAVAGSKHSAVWDSEAANDLWLGYRQRENGTLTKDPSILPDATKKIITYPGGHSEGFADSFKQNFASIYSAVAQGNATNHEYATFEDGLREMRLCEKIVESAKERRWVTL